MDMIMKRGLGANISAFVLAVALCLVAAPKTQAQSGTLGDPFPPPSPNAALHYQRALLLMSALDETDRALLQKPIWEVLPGYQPNKQAAARIKRTIYRARNATKAAGKGSRLTVCDFGIDFSDAGSATLLPHAQPMVELGRLLTLRAAYAQSQEHWDEAAVIYFDALRLGMHLTGQPTLIEAVAGMQVLENNYFALAHWAAACPNKNTVARVFGLFEMMAGDTIRPAHTLACETGILAGEIDSIARAHPNGAWGAMILQTLDHELGDDEKANRELAVAACVKAGVSKDVFANARSFRKYLSDVKRLDLRFAEAASAAMVLPPQARIERASKLLQRYQTAAGVIGQRALLDPVEIGVLFAAHEAKTTLLRVCLAVGSRRSETGFPATLDDVRSGFGGTVPGSPYDDSSLLYEVFDDGKAFQVGIKEVRVGETVLPEVEFASTGPVAAQ